MNSVSPRLTAFVVSLVPFLTVAVSQAILGGAVSMFVLHRLARRPFKIAGGLQHFAGENDYHRVDAAKIRHGLAFRAL